MQGNGYVQLLDLACGAVLLTAILVLWCRELTALVRLLAVQGFALAALVAVLAAHDGTAEQWVLAAGILVLRGVILPWLLRKAIAGSGELQRETRPLVNIASSLLSAAVLALIAYAVSQPLVELAPSPATQAIPAGVTVVLVGFFVLVTRRRAVAQLVGFLVLDNGISAVGFLTTSSAGLVVELGISLDVLLAVLVLQILTSRMRDAFGDTDLDDLRELHD